MKDLQRLVIYSLSTVLMIFILVYLARTQLLSGNTMAIVAIAVVVVLPVILGVIIGKREHSQQARGDNS